MKITYAAQVPIPSHRAYAVHVMHMCEAFAGLGHEVTLYAMPPSVEALDPFVYYGLSADFCLEHVRLLPLRGISGPLYGRSIVRKSIAEDIPDLIYSRHIYAAYAAFRSGLPVIYEVHMPFSNSLHRMLLSNMLRDETRFALVAITQALKEQYLRDFPRIPADRICVAHDGAVLPGTTILPDPAKETLRVGYVGNLYPGKGMELIVEIAARMPDLTFDIVGGRKEDVRYWRNCVRGNNLVLHGQQPHGALQPFFDGMDVMLLPLQREVSPDGGNGDISRWTSPMKMFEYMAQGRAIIASDLPVLGEVLIDGHNALIAPGNDPDAWVRAIRRLQSDAGLRCRLGENARQELETTYTWTARCRQILSSLPSGFPLYEAYARK